MFREKDVEIKIKRKVEAHYSISSLELWKLSREEAEGDA